MESQTAISFLWKTDRYHRMSIDLLIGGAGLAGLRIGLAALRAHRTHRVVLLEKEAHTGGRVLTYEVSDPVPIRWEEGAGRISTQHTKTLALLKTYGLHTIPIVSETYFQRLGQHQPSPNPFDDLCAVYLDPLHALDPHVLATHTIKALLHQTIGPTRTARFLSLFPYYAETHTLRADLALQCFKEEMGRHHDFVICQEGLSALTAAMAAEFLERGGEIHHGVTITGVTKEHIDHHGVCLQVTGNHRTSYKARAAVLTMPCTVLQTLTGLQPFPFLRQVGMEPLVRIYAVFPLVNGKAWFDDRKIVTNSPLRYVIPMNPKQGTIMISYTEGPDALTGACLPKKDLVRHLMHWVRALFPDRTIPDPITVKRYPWSSGCSYWLPGPYDVKQASRASLHPDPTMPLFLAGESFAVKQCWMESALDQADQLLALPAFQAVNDHL